MTKKTIVSLVSIIAISTLMIGCGGSSSTTPAVTEPVADTGVIAGQTQTDNTTLDATQINAGTVSKDIELVVETVDKAATSTATIKAGTQFLDANGDILADVVPKIALTQKKGESATATETTKSVQTEINFTDANGNKITPTQAVEVKVKAPEGSKAGDEVQLSIPDAAEKGTGQQKLVIFIVDANGFLTVRILPDAFKNLTVIVIIVEKRTPVTGAS